MPPPRVQQQQRQQRRSPWRLSVSNVCHNAARSSSEPIALGPLESTPSHRAMQIAPFLARIRATNGLFTLQASLGRDSGQTRGTYSAWRDEADWSLGFRGARVSLGVRSTDTAQKRNGGGRSRGASSLPFDACFLTTQEIAPDRDSDGNRRNLHT